eukprot:949545_1
MNWHNASSTQNKVCAARNHSCLRIIHTTKHPPPDTLHPIDNNDTNCGKHDLQSLILCKALDRSNTHQRDKFPKCFMITDQHFNRTCGFLHRVPLHLVDTLIARCAYYQGLQDNDYKQEHKTSDDAAHSIAFTPYVIVDVIIMISAVTVAPLFDHTMHTTCFHKGVTICRKGR